MHEIVVVPDERFHRFGLWNDTTHREWQHQSYKFDAAEKPTSVLIYPHKRENTINLDLLRLSVWCKNKNIHLHCYGHQNSFPLHSIVADQSTTMDDYSNMLAFYGRIGVTHDGKIGIVDKSFTFYRPNEGSLFRLDGKYEEVDVADISPLTTWMKQVKRQTTDEEVIKKFTSMKVYVRRSTYELFERLTNEKILPTNSVWCEVKHDLYHNTMPSIDLIRRHDFGMPVVGLDYEFQPGLVDRVKEHYMGIQILTSLINNVYFFCLRGSSNLFSILPAKCICYGDAYLEHTVTALPPELHEPVVQEFPPPKELLKKILKARHGESGPLAWLEPWDKPHEGLVAHLKSIEKLIKTMWKQKPRITFI